jgi:hypothetical protein
MPHMKPHRTHCRAVFATFAHIIKSSFHTFVGGDRMPVNGASGIDFSGYGIQAVLTISGWPTIVVGPTSDARA